MTLKKTLLGLAGCIGLAGAANAELLQYQFNDPTGKSRTLATSARHMNPAGNITFALSGGIDRKVRISILRPDGSVLSSATSGLLGATDRITVNGKAYYGAQLTLPAPGEGSYTVKSEILSSADVPVSADSYSVMIDTTPPTVGAWSWGMNYGRGNAPDGIPIFSHVEARNITLDKVADALSGIDSVTYVTTWLDGPNAGQTAKQGAVQYFPDTKVAQLGSGAMHSLPSGAIPSGVQSKNAITFTVTDKAGNSRQAKLDFYNNSSCGPTPNAVGIKDPSYTGSYGGIAALKGFRPIPGSSTPVNQNPAEVLFVTPRENWRPLPEGAIYGGYPVGTSYQVLHTDSKNVYFQVKLAVQKNGHLNYPNAGWTNDSTWRCGALVVPNPQFTPQTMPPLWTNIEGYIQGVGWVPRRYGQPGTGAKPPRDTKLTRFRASVEPRAYTQVATILGRSCTIAPGATSCEGVLNHDFNKTGTAHHYHERPLLRNASSGLSIPDPEGYLWEWDGADPYIEALISHDPVAKRVVFTGVELHSGNTWNRIRMKSGGLIARNAAGAERKFNASLMETAGNKTTYTAHYPGLPSGTWDIYGWALDNHDNYGEKKLFSVISDNDAPSVKVEAPGSTIASLDAITISVADAVTTEPRITSVRLVGGPASDNVYLAVRPVDTNQYKLEYPVMFPSLKSGEEYTLTVSAVDDQGNEGSGSITFLYVPPMVTLVGGEGDVKLPAVTHAFTRTSGRKVLYTEPLTFAGGDQVIGSYDVYATLRSDAEVSLLVNGVRIDPGATMEVLPAHDFSLNEGRLELSVSAADPGVVGKASLLITTVAPNAPVLLVDISTWMPGVKLDATDWSIYPALQPVSISASVPAATPCLLTASPVQALYGNDPISAPRCLLRWTEYPNDLYQMTPDTEGAGLSVQGYAARTGMHKVGYEVYVFDADGVEVLIESGSRDLEVLLPDGSVTLGLKKDPGEIERLIGRVELELERKSGLECALTTDRDQAIDETALGRPTCLVTWKTIPSGLSAPLLGTTPLLAGSIDEHDNAEVNLAWELAAFTPSGARVELGSQELQLALVDPAAPEISMDQRNHIVDDLYSAPRRGGYLGDYTVEGRPGDIVLETLVGGAQTDRELVSPGFTDSTYARRQLIAEEKPLWTETPFNIVARYDRLPRVESRKDMRLLTVPSEDLRPLATPDSDSVLNTETLGVNVVIHDPLNLQQPYDASEMGKWEVRLLNYLSFTRQEPLTEFMQVDAAGKARFELDLKNLDAASVRIMPEARLISPVPEYQRTTLGARPLYITVLRGEAISSSIEIRRIKGEAPLALMAKLDLENYLDFKALGEVVWEVREEGKSEWVETPSSSTISDRFQHTFQAGRYELRARVFNRNSGAEFVTEQIGVHAYNVPTVKIAGPANAFIGSGATLRVDAKHKGEPVDEKDLVVMWSEDNGETWVEGGVEHTVVRDGEERVMVVARVRMADSPADWEDSYVQRRYRVSFRPVSPPRGSILGSRVIEAGKPVTWRGAARAPYPRMDVTVQGRFILPDGTIVDSDEVEYMPSEEDARKKRVELIYESWIVGFEDQGAEASVRRFINVWQYEWPDWSLGTRISATQAPAEVELRIRKPVGMGRYLEGVQYEWELPKGVEVVNDRTSDSRAITISEPGTYTVLVRISDDRGNSTELLEKIVIDEPDPWEVDFRMSASNADNRAPLDIRLSPNIRGGHPRDRISNYRYLLNGEPVSEGVRYSSVELMEGTHEITLEIESEFGGIASHTKTLEVAPNTPPVCELIPAESRSHMRFTAKCTDQTGRVVRHVWTVNGEELAISGSRISVSAREDMALHVSLRAIDDGGAESAPVSWHGSLSASPK